MHSTGSRADGDYLEVQIDETGDWGTKPGSSPYFFMTACAFRASNLQVLETAMYDLNQVLGRPQGQEIHSIRHLKDHEKLIEASERLTTIKELRVFFVIIPKAYILKNADILPRSTTIYNFLCRLMLERISCFARSMDLPAHPTFASVRRLPRENLDRYILRVQRLETDIEWNRLRLPVSVRRASSQIGLQWADISGRTLWRALVPSAKPPHRIEPMYLKALAPIIWSARPLETYGLHCIEPHWHKKMPWWLELDALIPENNPLS